LKNIFVRPINGSSNEELEHFKEVMRLRDAEVGPVYPETTILVAENGVPLLFQPVQSCFVMGSLGYGELTNLQLAQAMRQITATLVWESRKLGRGELYFIGGHPDSDSFAQNNDFQRVDKPVYRMRLKY
jgi:hypothetical protein